MSSRSRFRFGKLCFESRNLRLERLDFAFHRRAAATASVAGQAGKLALQGRNLLLDILDSIGRTVVTTTAAASATGLGRASATGFAGFTIGSLGRRITLVFRRLRRRSRGRTLVVHVDFFRKKLFGFIRNINGVARIGRIAARTDGIRTQANLVNRLGAAGTQQIANPCGTHMTPPAVILAAKCRIIFNSGSPIETLGAAAQRVCTRQNLPDAPFRR